jgi:hypothetical protein
MIFHLAKVASLSLNRKDAKKREEYPGVSWRLCVFAVKRETCQLIQPSRSKYLHGYLHKVYAYNRMFFFNSTLDIY